MNHTLTESHIFHIWGRQLHSRIQVWINIITYFHDKILSLAEIRTANLQRTKLMPYQLSCPAWISEFLLCSWKKVKTKVETKTNNCSNKQVINQVCLQGKQTTLWPDKTVLRRNLLSYLSIWIDSIGLFVRDSSVL